MYHNEHDGRGAGGPESQKTQAVRSGVGDLSHYQWALLSPVAIIVLIWKRIYRDSGWGKKTRETRRSPGGENSQAKDGNIKNTGGQRGIRVVWRVLETIHKMEKHLTNNISLQKVAGRKLLQFDQLRSIFSIYFYLQVTHET